MKKYKSGDIIKCQVSGIQEYGIFVNIDEYYDGLIHISEVSYDFVRDIKDYVKINEIIYAEVLSIDSDTQQINLSIKNIDYKNSGKKRKDIIDDGFKPLLEALPIWEEEYNENNKNTDENK